MLTFVSQKCSWLFWERKCQGIAGWFKSLKLESALDIHDSPHPHFFLILWEAQENTKRENSLKKVFHLYTLFSFKRMAALCQ